MKKLLVVALASVFLTACGGGGGSGSGTTTTAATAAAVVPTPNPNSGTYVSAWANSNGDVGTSRITIASDGKVSGTVTSPTAGTANLTGAGDNAGNFSATYTYPSSVPGTLIGTATRSGSFLNYNLVNKIGASTYTMAGKSILTTGSTILNSTGIWRGTITSSITGAGTVTNTVTQSGDTLTGSYVNSTAGTTGTFVGVSVGNDSWYVITPAGGGNCRLQGHATASGIAAGSTSTYDYQTLIGCAFSETGSGTLIKQ